MPWPDAALVPAASTLLCAERCGNNFSAERGKRCHMYYTYQHACALHIVQLFEVVGSISDPAVQEISVAMVNPDNGPRGHANAGAPSHLVQLPQIFASLEIS